MAFHRAIAVASGNVVSRQLLDVLTNLFVHEQRAILDIQNQRINDHEQHVDIHRALVARDDLVARQRMREHLETVRADLERWDPDSHPIHS